MRHLRSKQAKIDDFPLPVRPTIATCDCGAIVNEILFSAGASFSKYRRITFENSIFPLCGQFEGSVGISVSEISPKKRLIILLRIERRWPKEFSTYLEDWNTA